MSVFPKIEYVLFDMDGLMIDTEQIYTDVTNTILAPYGKEMTWDIKSGCMGKPEREAALHLLSFFPDIPLTLEKYLEERNKLQDSLWANTKLLPGIEKLVNHLRKHQIPCAVATGSRRRNFNIKTAHLQHVFELFEGKIVCADDARYLALGMRGKPNPDVFILAAREVLERDVGDPKTPADELSPAQIEERGKGLVFEDALFGVQAGKRAGMSVVWIPDTRLLDVEYNGVEKADRTLTSLEHFIPEQWGLPPYDV